MALKSYRQFMDEFNEADVAADAPPAMSDPGVQTKPSVRSTVNDVFGSLGKSRGQVMFNAERLVAKIMDKNPSDLRRILRKMLASGEFDDDPAFKLEMEQLHEDLSSSKGRSAARAADRMMSTRKKPEEPKDVIARPEPDGPGGPTGGAY